MKPFRLAGALALTALVPLAAHAADPLSLFQPAKVGAVSVTPADERALRALPPLEAFGTVRGTRVPGVEEVASARDAADATGFALRLPPSVPAEFGKTVTINVTQPAHTSFTFSAAKARAYAAEHHVALAAIPPHLDGATIDAKLAPLAVVRYGDTPAPKASTTSSNRRRHAPFLALVEAPLPVVRTERASLSEIAGWFRTQPGVPAHLAAQVAALGDPLQTLPIPVRFSHQTSTPVDVDGVRGLAVGDETGIGSAVVWVKDGRVYALGGTLAQQRLLALAATLR